MVTHRDLYDARLHSDLKVSDMVSNGSWLWPDEWYEKYHSIINLTVPVLDSNMDDKIVWRTNNGKEVEFSVSVANVDLNDQKPRVEWWKLIWYSQCIPKHSFILWLALHDRLSTQDNLMKWGIHSVNRSYLCYNKAEDLEHLLFQCKFATEI